MKNILITGISRGLGCEIAKKILSGGNTVYGISRTLSGELKKLDGDFPGKLKLLQFDLSDTDGILKNIFIIPIYHNSIFFIIPFSYN